MTNTPLAQGNAVCKQGSAEFTIGSGAPTYACSGNSAGGTIENGKTESGTWSTTISSAKYEGLPGPEEYYPGFVAVQFPEPLTALQTQHLSLHYVLSGHFTTECPSSEVPVAGNFCFYEKSEAPAKGLVFYGNVLGKYSEVNPVTTGFLFPMMNEGKEGEAKGMPEGYAAGTWALTAKE